MNDEVLVKVEGVSKTFCWSLSRFIGNLKRSLWYGVKDISSEPFGSSKNDQLLNLPVTLRSGVARRRVWDLEGLEFALQDSSFHYVTFRVTFPFNFYLIKWQI
jgi:hypothetical protein